MLVQLSDEVVDGEEGVTELVSSSRCMSRSFLCRVVLLRLMFNVSSTLFACYILIALVSVELLKGASLPQYSDPMERLL
jgi:hypothetical protein